MISKIPSGPAVCCRVYRMQTRSLFASTAVRSKQTEPKEEPRDKQKPSDDEEPGKAKAPKKTLAQLDEEMRAAMEGRSGDGGIAGAELEGGKAVSMKRGVRDNMFRFEVDDSVCKPVTKIA